MNKKIILFAAGAVLLAASAFTFASVNKSNDPMDDLFKANVEALAYNESGSEVVKCYCKTKWFSYITIFMLFLIVFGKNTHHKYTMLLLRQDLPQTLLPKQADEPLLDVQDDTILKSHLPSL